MYKVYISYEDYSNIIYDLCSQIDRKYKKTKFDFIYGFPRGGLPIATHLSHVLDCKLLTSQSKMKSLIKYRNVLIVDDISDTGKTFINLLNNLKNHDKIITATLHIKTDTKFKPNVYVREYSPDVWIVYPWEARNENMKQDYK